MQTPDTFPGVTPDMMNAQPGEAVPYDPANGTPAWPTDAPTGMRPDVGLGPDIAPPGDQQDVLPADDDTDEFQSRDRLAVELLLAAEGMTKAAGVAAGGNDADQAAKFASAAHDFVKAHVVLSPLEAADDLTHGTTTPQPTTPQQ